MPIIPHSPVYSGGQRPFGMDRWFAPIIVVKDVNDVVRVDLGAGYVDRILPAGDYYLMLGDISLSDPTFVLKSLFVAISALAGVGSMTWAYATPLLSAQSLTGGLALTATAVSGLRIDIGDMHASWSVVFGATPTDVIDVGWRSSYTIGAQLVIGPAASKFADYVPEQYTSGGARARYTYRWDEVMTREMVYRDVGAANIRRTRASEDPCWADGGYLMMGDRAGSWQDVWDPLSRGKLGIILHNYGFMRLNASGAQDSAEDTYEIIRLTDEAQGSFSATIPDVNLRGERYTLQANIEVLFSQYNHS